MTSRLRICVIVLFLGSLSLGSCRVRSATGGADAERQDSGAGGAASRPAAGEEARLQPARRPESSLDPESIPQLLARTRAELEEERAKNHRIDEGLIRAQTEVADLRAASVNTNKELESARTERDRLQKKVWELQERLVTAALRIAGAEKETLEAKIAYEKAVAAAADGGVIVDPNHPKEPAASQPAAKDPKDAAGPHAEHR